MRERWNLTDTALSAVAAAHDLADRLGHDDLSPPHVILGLLHPEMPTHRPRGSPRPGVNVASQVLFNLGVRLDDLVRELEDRLPPPGEPRTAGWESGWSLGGKRLVEQARDEGRGLGHSFCGPEHLLLALLRDDTGDTARLLARHGISHGDVRSELRRLYGVGAPLDGRRQHWGTA